MIGVVAIQMSYQADSTGFVITRQEFTVPGNLSEQYGYTDAFEGGLQPSVLDAVVAAHIAVFGEDKAIINEQLKMGTGDQGDFISSFMGDGLGNMTFLLNGATALNGAPAQELRQDDILELNAIHDVAGWSDAISWFEAANADNADNATNADDAANAASAGGSAKTEALTVDAGAAVDLTLWRNPSMGWGTPEPLGGAGIVRVSKVSASPGAAFSVPLATTDADGRASITFDLPGTYVLSAINGNEDSTIPLMSPWLEVTVNPPATVGEAPRYFDFRRVTDALTPTLAASLNSSNGYQSEWLVINLVQRGYLSDEQKKTYQDALSEAIAPLLEGAEGRLSATKATENSRVILALSALDIDATSFDGHDLTAPLADIEYVTQQGATGAAFALRALDSGNYGDKATRDALLTWLLDAQLDSGGWALSGSVADADTTAIVITALAPYYYTGNTSVDDAVEVGVNTLASLQGSDGFGTRLGTGEDSELTMTAESTATVIGALAALKIPLNDSRFVQNNENLYHVLLSYYIDNDDGSGAFAHLKGDAANAMATEQVMLALQAELATFKDQPPAVIY
ncbi:MAG: hypothetical protein LBP24_03850 [Coriobacteriales bacterium]|jgi:hypothetical protein|nr:hypothetical protein [Coriobacteriales bacterium]